jgi:hypothetical protein
MADEPQVVVRPPRRFQCRDHGEATPCLVCVHLHRGRGRGVHTGDGARAGGPAFAGLETAHCDRCEFFGKFPKPLAAAWSFAIGGPVMVCEHCLALIRLANEHTGS